LAVFPETAQNVAQLQRHHKILVFAHARDRGTLEESAADVGRVPQTLYERIYATCVSKIGQTLHSLIILH
jgi:hypothetical protein